MCLHFVEVAKLNRSKWTAGMDCVSCVAQIERDRDTNEWPGFIHLMMVVADDEQLHDASSSVVTIQPSHHRKKEYYIQANRNLIYRRRSRRVGSFNSLLPIRGNLFAHPIPIRVSL